MFAEDRDASIRQSVQNGQFLDRLAQDASDLFVASNTDQRIECLLTDVIVTAPALDQPPTLQPIESAYDCSTGHAHVGRNFCDRERLGVEFAKRHAQADEESLKARAEGLARWSVSSMHSSHHLDHETAEHQSLSRLFDLTPMIDSHHGDITMLHPWRSSACPAIRAPSIREKDRDYGFR